MPEETLSALFKNCVCLDLFVEGGVSCGICFCFRWLCSNAQYFSPLIFVCFSAFHRAMSSLTINELIKALI